MPPLLPMPHSEQFFRRTDIAERHEEHREVPRADVHRAQADDEPDHHGHDPGGDVVEAFAGAVCE